jgi:hypothetical protein
MLAVMFGVMTTRLGMVFFGVTGMAMGAMRMVRGLLVIAGLVVLGGLAVMFGGMLMMFGGFVMVFHCVFAHRVSPGWVVKVHLGYATPLTVC